MLKLTRLNNHIVAINPDHIGWAEATPDTTLFLIGGERIIVRESLDELIGRIVCFRRMIRIGDGSLDPVDAPLGDPPSIDFSSRSSLAPRGQSMAPSRLSFAPASRRGDR
jgi:flagellar protein FlbD